MVQPKLMSYIWCFAWHKDFVLVYTEVNNISDKRFAVHTDILWIMNCSWLYATCYPWFYGHMIYEFPPQQTAYVHKIGDIYICRIGNFIFSLQIFTVQTVFKEWITFINRSWSSVCEECNLSKCVRSKIITSYL
jgi:hypothetical protein